MLKMFFRKKETREMDRLKNENKPLKDELDKHKEFFERVYHYCGSYPNWKAQQEYRQIIQELIHERSGDHFFQPTEPLDQFLGNLVDATKKLLQSSRVSVIPETNSFFWNEGLAQARGDGIKIDWKHQ